jgi:hypothetical protein
MQHFSSDEYYNRCCAVAQTSTMWTACRFLLVSLFSFAEIAVTPPEIIPNRDGSLTRNVKPCSPPPSILGSGTGAGSRLAAWVIDSAPSLETLSKELGQVTQNIVQLTRILEQIESIPTIDAEVI